jgi:hypothetical protein
MERIVCMYFMIVYREIPKLGIVLIRAIAQRMIDRNPTKTERKPRFATTPVLPNNHA